MSAITKVLKGLAFKDSNGNVIDGKLASSAVIMPDGVTSLPDKLAATETAQTTALTTAINLLKDGGDGSTLPADRDNLKKLADALASTHTVVDEFLNGGATDNGVFDRVVELVTAISANKDSIDGLLTDKINVADIVNDLTTGGAGKVLSAEQGKTLKGIIDALETKVNGQIASLHTHDNKAVLDGVTPNHLLLSTKMVTEVPAAWPADVRADGVLLLVAGA